jgi:hypothetical protein
MYKIPWFIISVGDKKRMMKKIIFLLFVPAVAVFVAACQTSGETGGEVSATQSTVRAEKEYKRYGVKTGEVHYETRTQGKIMTGTVTGKGTRDLYFKDWGAVELREEKSEQTTTVAMFGRTNKTVNKKHTMDKFDHGQSYSVDFERKKIYVSGDAATQLIEHFGDKNIYRTGKEFLEQSGGKVVGHEKILGYNCEIWEIPGLGKMWIYKGVPLKMVFNIMGLQNIVTARSAEFGGSISGDKFKLPGFPVEKIETFAPEDAISEKDLQEAREEAKKYKDMTYEEFKAKMYKEEPDAKIMSEEEMRQSYEMFKAAMNRLSE